MSFSKITSLSTLAFFPLLSPPCFFFFFFPLSFWQYPQPWAKSETEGERGEKKIFKNNHNKKKLPPHEQKEKGPSRSRLYVPLRKTKGRYRGRQRRILGAATFATQKVEEEETQGGLETPLCFCLLC